MTAESVEAVEDTSRRLLHVAARMLVEYNERSALIRQHLDRLAARLGVAVSIGVAYRRVTLAFGDGRVLRTEAPELRVDTARSISVLRAIDDFCAGRIDASEALRRLESIEATSVRHGRVVVAALFGLAAAALAALLGADRGAIVASGASAAAGLLARQQAATRTRTVLVPPFAAALVGAVIGGVVIRADWTVTQQLCLIVPALMLVPGPHLINSIEDILENEMEAGLGRLTLAVAILLAAAFGVAVGGSLAIGTLAEAAPGGRAGVVGPVAIALAGVASAGFGAFQNSPWRVVWVSIACGAMGYAIRAACLAGDAGLAMGSLAACFTIGIAAGLASRHLHLPFASVAFACAAPLMPGLLIYRSIAAAMRIVTAGSAAEPTLAIAMLAPFLEAAFVVTAMVVGLLAGARVAASIARRG